MVTPAADYQRPLQTMRRQPTEKKPKLMLSNLHSSPCPAADGEEAWAEHYAGDECGEAVGHVEGDHPTHGRRNFKDTNPLMSSSLVILFGVVKQFGSFWIWSETECEIPAEYGLQHNSPLPPLPQTHTVCIYCT